MDQSGNNPLVLQILAAVGKEIGEDKRLHGEAAAGDDIYEADEQRALLEQEARRARRRRCARSTNSSRAAGRCSARRNGNEGGTPGRPARAVKGRADTPERARKCISSTVGKRL
jgi:hypothetical protein